MIRFILGVILILGVAGGIDNMPPDPSFSYVFWQILLTAVGFCLAGSGVSKMKG